MKKIFIITILLFTSCFPSKEVISGSYDINSELNFKILRYSEPTTIPGFIRDNKAKYVELTIIISNKSNKPNKVNFENFYIESDNGIKSQLWRVYKTSLIMNTIIKKEVDFKSLETKKLWLFFLTGKNETIKSLIFNQQKVELKYGKTKQVMH